MPNLLAMSFEGELAPSFDLLCLAPGRKAPDGWGIGYYPGGEPAAPVLKEPVPLTGSIRSELVKAWDHLASPLFVLHIRDATWGPITDANTQPFVRSFVGRDWLIAHSGSLREKLDLGPTPRFEPVGSTDTERVFCLLLGKIALHGHRSIGDIPPETLATWLGEINRKGPLSLVLADGLDLVAYADREGSSDLHIGEIVPPYTEAVFSDDDISIDLTRRGIAAKRGLLVSSTPLAAKTEAKVTWRKMLPGELAVIRLGTLRATAFAPSDDGGTKRSSVPRLALPRDRAKVRTFSIRHRTVYEYQREVERSAHVFRLTPAHDRMQALLAHQIHLSVAGESFDFEDAFGNAVKKVLLDSPYMKLVIEARSTVEARDIEPLSIHPRRSRATIPIAWMPWQRQILQPFLLPPELPQTQLEELFEYAMSFVRRNDYDLFDTLLDINSTLHHEYKYTPGATHLGTTAWEVYEARKGVCQDFTNLFICLSRLLSVPARYACGYVFTARNDERHPMGDASHAWVQVYLPEIGWKGFDPTNGSLTQTEHVRVAVGRNYVDATPTSGTIYVGGGPERMHVDVRMEES